MFRFILASLGLFFREGSTSMDVAHPILTLQDLVRLGKLQYDVGWPAAGCGCCMLLLLLLLLLNDCLILFDIVWLLFDVRCLFFVVCGWPFFCCCRLFFCVVFGLFFVSMFIVFLGLFFFVSWFVCCFFDILRILVANWKKLLIDFYTWSSPSIPNVVEWIDCVVVTVISVFFSTLTFQKKHVKHVCEIRLFNLRKYSIHSKKELCNNRYSVDTPLASTLCLFHILKAQHIAWNHLRKLSFSASFGGWPTTSKAPRKRWYFNSVVSTKWCLNLH